MALCAIACVFACCGVGFAQTVPECVTEEACGPSLLQTTFVMMQESDARAHLASLDQILPLPDLRLVGRSYYSTNPAESAEWVQRYLGGTSLNDDISLIVPGGIKATAGIDNWIVQFANATEPCPEADRYAKYVEDVWTKATKNRVWTHWGDLHDGIYMSTLNVTALREDQVEGWFFDTRYPLARLYVPGTSWTLEMRDADWSQGIRGIDLETGSGIEHITSAGPSIWSFESSPGSEIEVINKNHTKSLNSKVFSPITNQTTDFGYFEENTWYLEEPCRENEADLKEGDTPDEPYSDRSFWKITYAVVNASVAADSAISLLGAHVRSSPFPYPPADECTTGTIWLEVADNLFNMHMVESYDPDEHAEMKRYHELHAEKAAHLKNGCLHPLLYNNMAFEADSLDRYIERLDNLHAPYLVVHHEGLYSLTFAFPDNEAVVIQIRSHVMSKNDVAARGLHELTTDC